MPLLTPNELQELIDALAIAKQQLEGCAAWLSTSNQKQVAKGTSDVSEMIGRTIEKYNNKY